MCVNVWIKGKLWSALSVKVWKVPDKWLPFAVACYCRRGKVAGGAGWLAGLWLGGVKCSLFFKVFVRSCPRVTVLPLWLHTEAELQKILSFQERFSQDHLWAPSILSAFRVVSSIRLPPPVVRLSHQFTDLCSSLTSTCSWTLPTPPAAPIWAFTLWPSEVFGSRLVAFVCFADFALIVTVCPLKQPDAGVGDVMVELVYGIKKQC